MQDGWIVYAGPGLLVVLAFWLWRRNAWRQRYLRLGGKIAQWGLKRRGEQSEAAAILKEIHRWLRCAVKAGDEASAYRLLELLKQAYGEGMYQSLEFSRLLGVFVLVLRAPEMRSVSVMAIEAFTPLLRRAPLQDIAQAADQLGLIGVLALRYRKPFLVDKVAVEMLRVADRIVSQPDEALRTSFFRAARVLGAMCLRRRNMELFQPLIKDLQERFMLQEAMVLQAEWMKVLIFLLNRTARQNQKEAAIVLCDAISVIWSAGDASADLRREWLQELGAAAATACFNPHSGIDGLLMEMLTHSIKGLDDERLWRELLHEVKNLAVFAAMRHGMERSRLIWLPVLEIARKDLRSQMRSKAQKNSLRHARLLYVLQALEAYIGLLARQEIQKTPLDILKELFQLWHETAIGPQRRKSILAFSQLTALRWLENKRKAKRYLEGETWLEKIILPPELLWDFSIKASYLASACPAK